MSKEYETGTLKKLENIGAKDGKGRKKRSYFRVEGLQFVSNNNASSLGPPDSPDSLKKISPH